jgi:TonB family protein
MYSHSKDRKFFYLLLGAVFILHLSFMLVQVRDQFTVNDWRPELIKIKLVKEALQDLAPAHKKQIVQSEDSLSDEEPLDAAFLSDKNRKFDRQTVSKNIDLFKKAAKGNAIATQSGKTSKSKKNQAPSINDLKLSDVGITSGAPFPKIVKREPASLSKKGLENGDPESSGFSATNDYVQEVTLGDFTHLNTVEYKFYGFFHRIRQKLEQFWGKSIQEKSLALFKSGRRMPASQDLITSLQVTLNERGEIIGVKILGASGVKELDDAAVESFNQAGPFPNPPKDLLINGKATIEWGFVVKS